MIEPPDRRAIRERYRHARLALAEAAVSPDSTRLPAAGREMLIAAGELMASHDRLAGRELVRMSRWVKYAAGALAGEIRPGLEVRARRLTERAPEGL